LDLFRLASMQQKNICCSTIALLLRVGVDVWESLQRQLRSLNDKMAAEMSVAFGIHWNIQKMVPGAESLVLTVIEDRTVQRHHKKYFTMSKKQIT
jgi:hypothetical protein